MASPRARSSCTSTTSAPPAASRWRASNDPSREVSAARDSGDTSLSAAGRWIAKLADLRAGEGRTTVPAFVVLFLTVAAHTMLETARDALFLAKLPARDLNLVYVALAGITVVATFASTRLTLAIGRRQALVVSLVGFALGTAGFFLLLPTRRVALGLYLFSGVEGAMLVPQFWLLADDLFTVAQARRLFGSITAGGVLGAVAGAGGAALIVRVLSVPHILPVTAALFVAAAAFAGSVRGEGTDPDAVSRVAVAPLARDTEPAKASGPFRENPFLLRIAALVGLSTAAVLVVDYLFKSTAVRVVPPAALGFFFARYYAVMNAVSLVVQVFIAGRLVRRVGVIGAAAVTPVMLLSAAIAAALQGGFVVVLWLKTCDGGLRYSLNRVATELLYLPVPSTSRQKAKGFIDSALGRVVQAVTAVFLYLLAVRALATPRLLALVVALLSALWLAVAITLRSSYLNLFRGALARGEIDASVDVQDLDLTSAGALVEALASPDPVTVVAAMDVLAEHGRSALVPGLILYHDASPVLIRALRLFGRTTRTDWVPLAERLLGSADEAVAIAAVSALAQAGRLDALARPSDCQSGRVQAYIAFYRARAAASAHVEEHLDEHPLLTEIMNRPGAAGVSARRSLLAAACDAADAAAVPLLLALALRPELAHDEEAIERLAFAITTLKDPRFLPFCIARLAQREGRDAIREALVAIGDPALHALEAVLHDPAADRHVRLHVPRSLSRFGSQRAADILLHQLVHEDRGMVRYKVLRALGQLVARHDVKVDRTIIDREASKNIDEYLRLLSLRVAILGEPTLANGADDSSKQVLLGLLEDKLRQALERAFRLLQIAHPREDIETVHRAARSNDKTARANAGEFLDVLLVGREQQHLRRLLRIVVDDADDASRVARARADVPGLAQSYRDALLTLLADRDDVLAALAAQHALALDEEPLRKAVQRARETSPSLSATTERLFGKPLPLSEAAHA